MLFWSIKCEISDFWFVVSQQIHTNFVTFPYELLNRYPLTVQLVWHFSLSYEPKIAAAKNVNYCKGSVISSFSIFLNSYLRRPIILNFVVIGYRYICSSWDFMINFIKYLYFFDIMLVRYDRIERKNKWIFFVFLFYSIVRNFPIKNFPLKLNIPKKNHCTKKTLSPSIRYIFSWREKDFIKLFKGEKNCGRENFLMNEQCIKDDCFSCRKSEVK